MKNFLLILVFLTVVLHTVSAQREMGNIYARPATTMQQKDTNSTKLSLKNIETHLSLGTSVFADKYSVSSFSWVAPEISYTISPKVKVNMGFVYGADLFGSARKFPTSKAVNLAPLEKTNKPYYSMYGQVEYMPNERLWLSASIFYENGLSPFFYGPYASSLNVQSIGFSAAMEYKISENSILGINITFIQRNIEGLGFSTPYFQDNSDLFRDMNRRSTASSPFMMNFNR